MTGIATGIMIVFMFLYFVSGCSHKKEVAQIKAQLLNCQNAPVKIDTIFRHDTIYINKVRTVAIHSTDTIYKNGHMQIVNLYIDTLKTKDFDLRYKARTIGVLKDIEFPSYVLHTPEIYITKTVMNDTCINKPAGYIARNHWIIEGNIIGSNINRFPNFDLGVSFSIKDRIKLNLGGEYNAYHNEFYGKLGIGVYLR